MHLSFDNHALRGRVWEGDVLYISGVGAPVLGKLVLSSTSFTFRRPTDRQGWPFLGGKLPASGDAVLVNDGRVILNSVKGTYCFELFPSCARSLREWVAGKAESMEIVSRLSDSFLGAYEAYPHPFVETHIGEDQEKDQIFRFLGECVPILKEPINWGISDVRLQIEEDLTEIRIGDWKYRETKVSIQIDCEIYECGFFDDSEMGMEFHYEISYLGSGKLSRFRFDVENEKLNHKFLAKQNTYPEISGSENFIAGNPFGLNGFYRIKWSLHFD